MLNFLQPFWTWYERHYRFHVAIAAFLFILQLIHLYWLSAEVVLTRLIGSLSLWPDWGWLAILITFIDYTEIPALIATSLIYIDDLHRGRRYKPFIFLLLLNSQWLHIFWITDEFVVDHLTGNHNGTILPLYLAWIAIAIDYLEIPVMIDLFVKLLRNLRHSDFKSAAEGLVNH